MIPLRDENPRQGTPYVTYIIILANVLVWILNLTDPYGWVVQFGLIPWELLTGNIHPDSPLIGGIPSIFTSMFMHGGFLHLAGNMLYMWIFADNIEDDAGTIKFVIFYLLCGIGAASAQVAAAALQGPIPLQPIPMDLVLSGQISSSVHTEVFIPMVGASGAIAGVLGAYVLLYPKARIVTLIPLGFFLTTFRLPALLVIGFWFALQLFSGLGGGGGGVAWWAHIGGFACGIVLVKVMGIKPKKYVKTMRRGRFGEPKW